MKGSAHPGDKNFHKSKRSLLEGGFRELFYARPRRGNAMILLKFEDDFQPVKPLFFNIMLQLLQGTFVLI